MIGERTNGRVDARIPARAGVGLKPRHYRTIIETRPDVAFFEVHAENYMGAGGPPHRFLEAIRAAYPLSVHGVGLSLGSSEPLDREHLERLRRLVARYDPGLVSEHLAWSTHGGVFFADLLPLPYTQETLSRVCAHVDQVQTALRRSILIENPSAYVCYVDSDVPETEFLAELAVRTGCALLLDVTNVVVSAVNRGASPQAYIDAFPMQAVQEIHLAGFSDTRGTGEQQLSIDDHGSAVRPDVWSLYRRALTRRGAVPSLIEWDNDVPDWPVLLREAHLADALLNDRPRSTTERTYAQRLA